MAVKKPKITKREFLIAQAFLKGAGGNKQNTYLILAVVAWLRAMNKSHDPYWKSLKNLTAGAVGARLAKRLLNKAKAGVGKADYKAIIKRLREQHKTGNGMASQAADFILGISKSKWDKNNYGYVPAKDGHWAKEWVGVGLWGYYKDVWVPATETKNPLFEAYAALTNNPNIPNSWWIITTPVTTTKTTVIPPRPQQPRSLLHVRPERDYIEPYAVSRWYEAKPHYGDNVLLDPD